MSNFFQVKRLNPYNVGTLLICDVLAYSPATEMHIDSDDNDESMEILDKNTHGNVVSVSLF